MIGLTQVPPAGAQDARAQARSRMVTEIAAMARETGGETGRSRFSDAVMAAMGKVQRHRFVPFAQEMLAYENRPLPLGQGQTISQPYIVALMTDLADPKPSDTVLEVGTGSGYQAAVLAEIVAKVYTIEIVEALGKRAAKLLGELGYRNVQTRIGDGYGGCAAAGRFEVMGRAAAAGEGREPLSDGLRAGGRMVLAVGGRGE